MALFDLKDQLVFYGSYHHNKWNKLIHLFFVPLIWWTAVVWACQTGPLVTSTTPQKLLASAGLDSALPAFFVDNLEFNFGFFAFVAYALYYLTLDLFAGLTFDIILFGLLLSANAFLKAYGDRAWMYALVLHLLSWFMQIAGHGVLERRKPALTDSFFQSLVLAPLFVWFEFLFMFGYRQRLQDELEVRILANIKEYRAVQQAKKEAKGK